MNAIEQYFPVLMFTMLYKVVQIFGSAYEIDILQWDYLNKTALDQYFPVVLFIMLYNAFL